MVAYGPEVLVSAPQLLVHPTRTAGPGPLSAGRLRAGLVLFLASRSLLRGRATLALLLVAVGVGTGLQVPATANLAGYTQELLRAGVSTWRGDVVLTPARGRYLRNVDGTLAQLHALPWVRAAVPSLTLPAAVVAGARMEGTQVVGLTPDRGESRLDVLAGRLPGAEPGVALGQSLAERMDVTVGDTVTLNVITGAPAQPGALRLEDSPVEQLDLRVTGLVTGTYFGETRMAFVDRRQLLRVTGEEDAATRIAVFTGAPDEAAAHAGILAASMPSTAVLPWQQDSGFVSQAIAANHIIATSSHVLVLVAVTIPVWALLFISVQRERRDIAVLAAMGFNRRDLFSVYLARGLLVAGLGIAAGLMLGWAVTRHFSAHPIFAASGFVIRPALTLRTLVEPAVVAAVATLLGSLHPALSAARAQPATIMRETT